MTNGQKAIVRTIALGNKVTPESVSAASLLFTGGTITPNEAKIEIEKFYDKARVTRKD